MLFKSSIFFCASDLIPPYCTLNNEITCGCIKPPPAADKPYHVFPRILERLCERPPGIAFAFLSGTIEHLGQWISMPNLDAVRLILAAPKTIECVL